MIGGQEQDPSLRELTPSRAFSRPLKVTPVCSFVNRSDLNTQSTSSMSSKVAGGSASTRFRKASSESNRLLRLVQRRTGSIPPQEPVPVWSCHSRELRAASSPGGEEPPVSRTSARIVERPQILEQLLEDTICQYQRLQGLRGCHDVVSQLS